MFYCQDCAKRNDWPNDEFVPRSRGPCEVCGKTASCYDVPSSCLPLPPPKEIPEAELKGVRAAVKKLQRRVEELSKKYPELEGLELRGVPEWAEPAEED